MADSFHIVVQRFHIPVPVFADSVEVIAFLASYGIEELGDKLIFLGEPFEIQGWTGYSFHGRKDKYSDFKWHWYHFSGTGFDDAQKRSGIFQIQGEGKAWSDGVDGENGKCHASAQPLPLIASTVSRHWGDSIQNTASLHHFP